MVTTTRHRHATRRGHNELMYLLYDLQHAMLTPARLGAEALRNFYRSPGNPISYTSAGRTLSAYAEMFERMTRRFGKPDFNLPYTMIGNRQIEVREEIVCDAPFGSLLHFKRATRRNDPKVLLVAPMSGHFATLLRGTVEALLPHHDVYITDWKDTRQVPLSDGRFNLDDYIAYLRDFMTYLGPDTHVIAVCQPAPPVFAAIALMEAENNPNTPRSMTLMGGPIDPRISKTKVTELAETRPLSWFKETVTMNVPAYYPGGNRRVYPGFVQLGGFMSMNLDRHVGSHLDFFHHLVAGDGDSAEAHRKFYNEYLSVMDLNADFYLQTVETIFQKHSLPKGEMIWTDPATGQPSPVDPRAIRKTAILTVEGELDDISAHGQTTAAHTITPDLPADLHFHHFQEDVGHYGIFNGRRWRTQIMPRIRHFIRTLGEGYSEIPAADLDLIPDHAPEKWNPKLHSVEAVQRRMAEKNKDAGRAAS